MLMSNSPMFAPKPAATLAAFFPTTPPPRMVMCAGSTPGTPPKRMPRPICGRSRYLAPSWMLMRPATSLIGGKVEVGKHDLSAAQPPQLGRLRLLDLHDHVGLGVDFLGAGGHFGPVLEVVVVGQPRADSRHGLDQHAVPGPGQLLDPHRQQSHAILVAFDLLRHSDDHLAPPGRRLG